MFGKVKRGTKSLIASIDLQEMFNTLRHELIPQTSLQRFAQVMIAVQRKV